MWTTLETNFLDVSRARMCNIMEQLMTPRCQPGTTMHNQIAAFDELYQEVKTFDDIKIGEGFWVCRFLRSLPADSTDFARFCIREFETTKLTHVYHDARSEFETVPDPTSEINICQPWQTSLLENKAKELNGRPCHTLVTTVLQQIPVAAIAKDQTIQWRTVTISR
jgi:hypothetical protein